MFLVVSGGHMRMAKGGSGKPDSRPVSRNFNWISCWFDDGRGASPAIRVWPAGANTAIFKLLIEQFNTLQTTKKMEAKRRFNKMMSAYQILVQYESSLLGRMAYSMHNNNKSTRLKHQIKLIFWRAVFPTIQRQLKTVTLVQSNWIFCQQPFLATPSPRANAWRVSARSAEHHSIKGKERQKHRVVNISMETAWTINVAT